MRGRNQLYNIETDPQEQINLIDEKPQVAAKLLLVLDNHVETLALLEKKKGDQVEMNQLQIENLKGLGYIQ